MRWLVTTPKGVEEVEAHRCDLHRDSLRFWFKPERPYADSYMIRAFSPGSWGDVRLAPDPERVATLMAD